jgi:hypothetical protein
MKKGKIVQIHDVDNSRDHLWGPFRAMLTIEKHLVDQNIF